MPPIKSSPSNLELQVLSVLWERGASTVRDVLDALPDGKQRAYTTVLTVMQNMVKKGLLARNQQGTAHVYRPTDSKQKTLGPVLKGLLQNVFGGSVSTVMQHLLQQTNVSDDELAEIRRLIEERKNGKTKGRSK